jgi:hypothetical protein
MNDEVRLWKLGAPPRKHAFRYKEGNPYGFHAAHNIAYILQNPLEWDRVVEG